jgi:hypothetical protein
VRALSTADLVEVWERGVQAHPLVRPLVVLATGLSEKDAVALAREPLSSLNRRLWELRATLTGTEVVGCVACPACGEQVEFELDSRAVAGAGTPPPVAGVRALTLADLLAAADEPDPARALAERCLPAGYASLTEASATLALADPDAEVLLDLACPGCGHGWAAPLDVASYLWAELDRLAGDVVREVDLLARCYGWSERDVLTMSPVRRRRYVELASAVEVVG